MTTWTPPALASSARAYRHDLWRVVEAQHTASTMRLVDSVGAQDVLERVLEASKPPLPAAAASLHYLLSTPFRYRSGHGSRFRAAHASGVWYGAEAARTALAEKSYWRLRFLLDAPALPALKAVPHTLFAAAVRTAVALDLTAPPLSRERAHWTHPRDYAPSQALAATARSAGIEAIRYESVRDPLHAACCVVLVPELFMRARSKPKQAQTWFIAAGRDKVRCVAAARNGGTFEFGADQLLGE